MDTILDAEKALNDKFQKKLDRWIEKYAGVVVSDDDWKWIDKEIKSLLSNPLTEDHPLLPVLFRLYVAANIGPLHQDNIHELIAMESRRLNKLTAELVDCPSENTFHAIAARSHYRNGVIEAAIAIGMPYERIQKLKELKS